MMLYCQSPGKYNKIAVQLIGEFHWLMAGSSLEIEGMNSLDPQVITAIHNQYYPDIYRFTRFRVSDEVIAEDITGEVFTRLLEAIHRGRGPTKNLRGWLFRTAANIVNDHFRKIYKHPVEDPYEMDENYKDLYLSHGDPVATIEMDEQKQIIRCGLEKLTEAQKFVITLRFGNKLSIDETANIMGKNTNAIKALQCRALVALRKNIGNEL